MNYPSFAHKLTQLQALFPWTKSSGCFAQEAFQFWYAESLYKSATLVGPLSQHLSPPSRMARLSETEETLGYIQQLQQQLQQQICLRKTIQDLRQGLCPSDVYRSAIEGLIDFFQADWVFILEKKPSCWQPVIQCPQSSLVPSPSALNSYIGLDSIVAQLMSPAPISVNEQSLQHMYPRWRSQFPGAWLLVPIHLPNELPLTDGQGHPWGLAAIGRQDEHQGWSMEQHDQAETLVGEFAIALYQSLRYEELEQKNQDLKALALTDSLTGLANRRQFDLYFNAEWHRLAREQQPLTLIMCDIDYFKYYNDYYGHLAGDTCLANVSDRLARCIRRPADLAARYGGEEFAVVLPNTDTEGGYNIACSIQTAMAEAAIAHAKSTVSSHVTFTMGVATVIPRHQLASEDLLEAADLALYHAKQQGRDRIYVHAHYCVPVKDGTDDIVLERPKD